MPMKKTKTVHCDQVERFSDLDEYKEQVREEVSYDMLRNNISRNRTENKEYEDREEAYYDVVDKFAKQYRTTSGVLVLYPWFEPDFVDNEYTDDKVLTVHNSRRHPSEDDKKPVVLHETNKAILFNKVDAHGDEVAGSEYDSEVWIPKSAIMFCGLYDNPEELF